VVKDSFQVDWSSVMWGTWSSLSMSYESRAGLGLTYLYGLSDPSAVVVDTLPESLRADAARAEARSTIGRNSMVRVQTRARNMTRVQLKDVDGGDRRFAVIDMLCCRAMVSHSQGVRCSVDDMMCAHLMTGRGYT